MAGRFVFVEDDIEPDESTEQDEEKKIISINIPFKNAALILMSHPSSLYLYKYVSVELLSGGVTINGYDVKKNQVYRIWSSEKTDLVEVKTTSVECTWKKKSWSTLNNALYSLLTSRETLRRVDSLIKPSTVILHVKRCPFPPAISFARFYHPEVFAFTLHKNDPFKDTIWFADKETSSFRFSRDLEEISCKITRMIHEAKMVDDTMDDGSADYPRILVYGPRNSGKSTLLKFLVNKQVATFGRVFYLDTDPGQPEFTPPGVVSLTEVDKPFFGPPFFHQNRKSEMIFTGDVSPTFVELYNDSVQKLMNEYNESNLETLFVNTMGWVEGTGLQCLINTILAVKPTVLIEIVAEYQTVTMFDYRSYVSNDTTYYQIYCKHDLERKTLPAKEMRDVCLITHFGRCQPNYLQTMRINGFMPYCVSWKRIAIFIYPERTIPISRTAQSLNGSIVALCTVDEDCIIDSGSEDFPLTVKSDSLNKFLAYGLVQAIDELNEILYIITPLKKEELKMANAIMQGNIVVPDALILKQEIYNVNLPFTNVKTQAQTEEGQMDTSMLSLKNFSENENETPQPRPSTSKRFDSTGSLRKPARKRYTGDYKRRSLGR